MPETRLPAVRIPSLRSEGENDSELGQEAIVVELPPSNKFAIAWPVETLLLGPHPLTSERTISLSSSEGETDVSEDELKAPHKRTSKVDEPEEADFVTPTTHLNLDHNPMDHVPRVSSLPRLSRALSMPLPSQLSALQNPRRVNALPGSPSPLTPQPMPYSGHFHELSLELADSAQTVIQTLLQLSPTQVLDPAKEQLSACSLSIPTPSISAMFTAMKNLNYISANMAALSTACTDTLQEPMSMVQNDFDIGEMLQSVGDTLSGMVAQVGVDLVLFHGDVGLKHVAVKGDESGISYTLSHILRQVIGVAKKGDSVEVGLFIESTAGDSVEDRSSTLVMDTPWRCIFHIAHRHAGMNSNEEVVARYQPSFDSLILRRLLRHVGGFFEVDCKARTPSFFGFACEVQVVLDAGDSSTVHSAVPVTPEAFLGYPESQIAQEPTLEQLAQFAETLLGKKATLYATSNGPFAHHLSSYLTAWGMDVSHVSTESDSETAFERADLSESRDNPTFGPGVLEQPSSPSPAGTARGNADTLSFVLIDDDVKVLRDCLVKLKAEQVYPLSLSSRKRPSLASNHRPKSSPQVTRVMGPTGNGSTFPHIVIVHFTSLSKFKLVKDAIQSILTPYNGTNVRIPEIIVIPKPAGPRRFLTALHTAVTKPVVDPFFVPIATSPSSPGLHAFSSFFNINNAPKSPSGRSTGSTRATSDRSNRSPKEHPAEGSTVASSPLGGDRMEYFSDAAVRLGSSPSTGLVIQSPDGQPAGIFFHPKGRPYSTSTNAEREDKLDARQRGTSFLFPAGPDEPSVSRPVVLPRSRPRSQVSMTDELVKGQRSPSTSDDLPTSNSNQSVAASEASSQVGPSHFTSRRSSQVSQASSPPTSPQTRQGGPTVTMRRVSRRQGTDSAGPSGQQKKKGPGDSHIVPPISVLIVDDNPIEQTILSTFMKKKKIKYDVAKNGEEAVNKWRTGVFHLILMDIQMPVMDGIQATKEIRRLEKQNAAGVFPSTPQSEGQRTPSDASSAGGSQSSLTPSYRSSVIIVALTASSLQADRVAALAAGCNDFLTKPVTLDWLNGKIIEWGSIKALQMWADIRPDVVRSISSGQAAQAQNVARRLHVPEGRSTPTGGHARSRASSLSRKTVPSDTSTVRLPVNEVASSPDKPTTLDTPPSDDIAVSSSRNEESGTFPHPVAISNDARTPCVNVIAPTPTLPSGEASEGSFIRDTRPGLPSNPVNEEGSRASNATAETDDPSAPRPGSPLNQSPGTAPPTPQ